jgi:hypothetical protein
MRSGKKRRKKGEKKRKNSNEKEKNSNSKWNITLLAKEGLVHLTVIIRVMLLSIERLLDKSLLFLLILILKVILMNSNLNIK